jgi:ligand-binding sensor domain-containing protein
VYISYMLGKQKLIVPFISLYVALFLIPAYGQIETSFNLVVTKIHQSDISQKAETLPEFRNDVHDTDYQGNQISGVIRTMFQDTKSNFWFGTQNGLCRKDKDGLVYFNLKDSNGQNVTIYEILEDKLGNIWVGYGGGIAKFDGTHFTVYHEKNILTSSSLWGMAVDSKGQVWVGTTSGLYTLNGESLTPFEIPEGKIDPSKGVSSAKMIHSIMEDSQGNMWFGTNNGVFKYDGDSLVNICDKNGLQSNFVGQVLESKAGNFWINTSSGVYTYNGDSLTEITEKLLKENDKIGIVFEDKNGTLWLTVNKRDIYSYDGTSFSKLYIPEGDFKPLPFRMYQDQDDRLWIVGLKGAHRLENNLLINVTRDGPW